MQLTSYANLFIIIFFWINCREVLFVAGGLVTMTPKGLQLQEGGDLADENRLTALNLIRSTRLHIINGPAFIAKRLLGCLCLLARCCGFSYFNTCVLSV